MLRSLVCALLLTRLLCADVTMRSKMDYRLASYLPATMADTTKKQMEDLMSNGTLLRIKGKRSYMSAGPLVTITDGEKGTITLIDPKGKRYAITTLSEYADKIKGAMPQLPEAARQMLANLQIDVKTDKTGKTETIKGFKTEENVITMSVDMPGPGGPGMSIKMEMHMWMATQEELARVPALNEISAYMKNQAAGNDPMGALSKMFGQMPGLADKMKGPMEQLTKSGAVLRSEIRMLMPAMAKMMGASNADEPFMQMTTDLTELSTEPVPDSAFQVPEGYQEAKIEEVVSGLNPMKPAAPKQEPPAPAPAQAGVYRVGGGVTAPRLVAKSNPSYTEEDRVARVQGTVSLYIQVSPEGRATNMRVLHSLTPGLDQRAMESVAEWRFEPGMKNGAPVTVEAQVEVNFRLLDDKEAEALAAATPNPVPASIQQAAQMGGYPAKATMPKLIRKTEPEYTEEARQAKFQGTVTLSAVINAEGVAQDLRVVHTLGMGLDEKAIEAVKQWKFEPGTRDGKPVATMSTIEVNFRL
jgi:TonB family protein